MADEVEEEVVEETPEAPPPAPKPPPAAKPPATPAAAKAPEPAAAAATAEAPPPSPEPKDGAEARLALKKLREEKAALAEQVRTYREREDAARKAQLSREETLAEELAAAKAEAEEARAEVARERLTALKAQVGARFNLPERLVNRLQGESEEDLTVDAQELAKLLPKPAAGRAQQPVTEGNGGTRTYTRSQIADRAFFVANEKDILLAQREGRILPG